ncbi:helix-turn-helix transcriptional regulator [Streptomyces sp. NPDC050804]|uniref:helix-turn-helix domain-containing protein n=1 Tax=Streptomyces sp. NPDC050804 TaxID=3154745 RepID=UPI00343500E2
MTGFHAWDDVKREVFDAEDLDEITAGARRMVAEACAHRLAEMRRQLGLPQSEVAARMHVRQERVSAIERGNATEDQEAVDGGTRSPRATRVTRPPQSLGVVRIRGEHHHRTGLMHRRDTGHHVDGVLVAACSGLLEQLRGSLDHSTFSGSTRTCART